MSIKYFKEKQTKRNMLLIIPFIIMSIITANTDGHRIRRLNPIEGMQIALEEFEICLDNFKIQKDGSCSQLGAVEEESRLLNKYNLGPSGQLSHSRNVQLAEHVSLAHLQCSRDFACGQSEKCVCAATNCKDNQLQSPTVTCSLQYRNLQKHLKYSKLKDRYREGKVKSKRDVNGYALPLAGLNYCFKNFQISFYQPCDQAKLDDAKRRYDQTYSAKGGDYEQIPLAVEKERSTVSCIAPSTCINGICTCEVHPAELIGGNPPPPEKRCGVQPTQDKSNTCVKEHNELIAAFKKSRQEKDTKNPLTPFTLGTNTYRPGTLPPSYYYDTQTVPDITLGPRRARPDPDVKLGGIDGNNTKGGAGFMGKYTLVTLSYALIVINYN